MTEKTDAFLAKALVSVEKIEQHIEPGPDEIEFVRDHPILQLKMLNLLLRLKRTTSELGTVDESIFSRNTTATIDEAIAEVERVIQQAAALALSGKAENEVANSDELKRLEMTTHEELGVQHLKVVEERSFDEKVGAQARDRVGLPAPGDD